MDDNKITITIRLIRSFEYRNLKNIVIRDVNADMSISDLKKLVIEEIKKNTHLPLPFKTFTYDTLKIEHQPFKAKTSDPVINCEHDDELILIDTKTLHESNIVNETEISYFKIDDYKNYKRTKEVHVIN